MSTFTNNVFKPRKDSGFVVKFRFTPDKAEEKQKNREQQIAKGHSDPYAGEELDFYRTFYIRKTFNSIAGIKNLAGYFTSPWYDKKDFIAFIYKVNDYDFPYAAYVKGKFVSFDNISKDDRDLYCSYSGSYVEEVCPLWTYVKEWP